MKSYPVFLRLEGRRVLLVGGSKVAGAKLPALIEAGARERLAQEPGQACCAGET